jgi:hypothetical protein
MNTETDACGEPKRTEAWKLDRVSEHFTAGDVEQTPNPDTERRAADKSR